MTGLAVAHQLVPLAWFAIVLGGASAISPKPCRVPSSRQPAVTTRRSRSPARWLGDCLRALAHRSPDADAGTRLGRALLLGALAGAAEPVLGLLVVAASYLGPRVRAARARRRRVDEIWDTLPDVVDLFRLAVSAGLTVPLALDAVARRTDGPIGAGLHEACDRIRMGARLGDSVMALTGSLGEPVRPLARALAGADRYGVALDDALERVGVELRLERRRRGEIAARRIPIKLLFPLVVLVLPAFALLTVVPVLVSALDGLGT